MRDVIVVGAGIAGLSAAWRLRRRDILVLEADHRVGGRVQSQRRGPYWLNWGGHVYAGPGSATDDLVNSVGVESIPVPGLLKGLAMKGKLFLDGRVETIPFRVPMSMKARADIMRAGAKVRLAVRNFGKMVERLPVEDFRVHQQRVYEFMNDTSFADFTGKLTPEADALVRPTVSRSSGNPDQISAGAGIGYFNLVWSKGDGQGLTRNILGGPSTLTHTIASALGDRLALGARVDEVVHRTNSVVVRYTQNGVSHEEEARYAVLATQAPITRKIAVDIDENSRNALELIQYGPYVSAAFLTDETGEQVWDDTYAIATPERSFNVAFNMSNAVRHFEPFRQTGSSFMVFSPADLGRDLIRRPEQEILNIYLKDLDDIFPGFSNRVTEARVESWDLGLPYCFPGRAKLQPFLNHPLGRVYLAGDYLGTFYTETSIQTGYSSATDILSHLGTETMSCARTHTQKACA
ncbi:MAG: FAD-dependent oxidoreductase [Desulfobacterales bacterium]|nr:FAD-dependent oxidoreductase [Desulfobacterales bacterium]